MNFYVNFFVYQAWDSSGIAMDGCRLTYQGEEICKTCKENGPVIYHGARYRVPFSREYPHFEVSFEFRKSDWACRHGDNDVDLTHA